MNKTLQEHFEKSPAPKAKNIDNTKDRLAIYTEINGNRIKCLIDTGADTPNYKQRKGAWLTIYCSIRLYQCVR